MDFLTDRGHVTTAYIKKLTNIAAPIKPIITTTKVKHALSLLKPKSPRVFQSNVVYELKYSRCTSTYVGPNMETSIGKSAAAPKQGKATSSEKCRR